MDPIVRKCVYVEVEVNRVPPVFYTGIRSKLKCTVPAHR